MINYWASGVDWVAVRPIVIFIFNASSIEKSETGATFLLLIQRLPHMNVMNRVR